MFRARTRANTAASSARLAAWSHVAAPRSRDGRRNRVGQQEHDRDGKGGEQAEQEDLGRSRLGGHEEPGFRPNRSKIGWVIARPARPQITGACCPRIRRGSIRRTTRPRAAAKVVIRARRPGAGRWRRRHSTRRFRACGGGPTQNRFPRDSQRTSASSTVHARSPALAPRSSTVRPTRAPNGPSHVTWSHPSPGGPRMTGACWPKMRPGSARRVTRPIAVRKPFRAFTALRGGRPAVRKCAEGYDAASHRRCRPEMTGQLDAR